MSGTGESGAATDAIGTEEDGVVRTVRLRVAGIRMDLDFGPGHKELAAETARLWDHLSCDADPAGATPGAADLPSDAPHEGTCPAGTAPHAGVEPTPGPRRGEAGPGTVRRTYLVPPGVGSSGASSRGCSEGSGGERGELRGRADAVAISPGPGAAYALSGDVTRQVIGRLIGTRILLHAGVVDHPRLGVVAVVGASGAGKSTATSALGRGGGYLTDELAILDPATGAVTAYPKPVSRVVAGSRRKQDLPLEELELEPVAGVPGIDRFVLLDRDPASEPGIARVPLAAALLALVEQSSSLWAVPHGLAALARLVTAAGGALRARYAEAEQLDGLLAQPPAPVEEEWQEITAPMGAAPDEPASGARGPGTVGLAAPVQALAVEDGVVLLAQGRAAHLRGIGALLWEELAEAGPRSLAQLETHVVEVAGTHERSAELVAAAADALVADGWAVRS